MNALRAVFVFLALFCSVFEGGVIRKASDNEQPPMMTDTQMDAMLETTMPKHRRCFEELPADAKAFAEWVAFQFCDFSLKCDEKLDEELLRKKGAEISQKYNALAEETKNSLKLNPVILSMGRHFEEKVLCMNTMVKKMRKQNGTTGGGQQDTKEMMMNALIKCFSDVS